MIDIGRVQFTIASKILWMLSSISRRWDDAISVENPVECLSAMTYALWISIFEFFIVHTQPRHLPHPFLTVSYLSVSLSTVLFWFSYNFLPYSTRRQSLQQPRKTLIKETFISFFISSSLWNLPMPLQDFSFPLNLFCNCFAALWMHLRVSSCRWWKRNRSSVSIRSRWVYSTTAAKYCFASWESSKYGW